MENRELWAFYPLGANDTYAGIVTATSSDATEPEMLNQYRNLSFGPQDENKTMLIDRKQMIDDEAYRFMAVTIADGHSQWASIGYVNPELEIRQKADRLLEKYNDMDIVLTDADLNFAGSPETGISK